MAMAVQDVLATETQLAINPLRVSPIPQSGKWPRCTELQKHNPFTPWYAPAPNPTISNHAASHLLWGKVALLYVASSSLRGTYFHL